MYLKCESLMAVRNRIFIVNSRFVQRLQKRSSGNQLKLFTGAYPNQNQSAGVISIRDSSRQAVRCLLVDGVTFQIPAEKKLLCKVKNNECHVLRPLFPV